MSTAPPGPAGPPPTPDGLAAVTHDVLKEEHKQRRQEIGEMRGRMEADNRNGLILTGVIWSWLATNQTATAGHGYFMSVIVFLPAALMGFFCFRWYAMHKSIFTNAAYLRELEAWANTGLLGWETWLQEQRRKAPTTASLMRTGGAFWAGLIAANLLLAVFFGISRGWFAG